MKKITLKKFEQLKKAPKKEVLEALFPFVIQPKGRPKGETPALTPYERLKRHRERVKRK
jgi:hypothetical protein